MLSTSAASSPGRVAALVPSSTAAILLSTASILDSSSRVRLSSAVAHLPSDVRSAESLSRSCAASACDVWNSAISERSRFEILPPLLHEVVRRLRLPAELIDLRQSQKLRVQSHRRRAESARRANPFVSNRPESA